MVRFVGILSCIGNPVFSLGAKFTDGVSADRVLDQLCRAGRLQRTLITLPAALFERLLERPAIGAVAGLSESDCDIAALAGPLVGPKQQAYQACSNLATHAALN